MWGPHSEGETGQLLSGDGIYIGELYLKGRIDLILSYKEIKDSVNYDCSVSGLSSSSLTTSSRKQHRLPHSVWFT
jgi:hypothetical protein